MNTEGGNPMLELAGQYADELTAQFRTLNYFVTHSGEIVRVHEIYLRGVIARFLPAKIGVGMGFVTSRDWVSTQQDIILYNQQDYPVLFQVGDCVVVDHNAVAALIEVKTNLESSKEFFETLEKLAFTYEQVHHSYFVGLYQWEGLTLGTTLDTIWSYIRRDVIQNLHKLPSAIYARSKYLLLRNEDGHRESPPFHVLEINEGNEGQALLSLISGLWLGGLQRYVTWPWWLENWWRNIPSVTRLEPWPEDLLQVITTG